MPRTHLGTTDGQFIGIMWIFTNKGDRENPNVRCGLVGKESRTGSDDALFASTVIFLELFTCDEYTIGTTTSQVKMIDKGEEMLQVQQ